MIHHSCISQEINDNQESEDAMKLKRRDFLKLSAAAGATAALSGLNNGTEMNAFAASHEGKVGVLPGEWKPTTCQGCTTWCPAEVFIQDGRAVKVRGNRYSKQNDGKVCPRGHLSLQQVYDPAKSAFSARKP